MQSTYYEILYILYKAINVGKSEILSQNFTGQVLLG